MENLHSYDLAPDFDLKDQYGDRHRLEDLRGHNVVLTFYPKDGGEQTEAQTLAFRARADRFDALDADMFAISPKGRWSHRRLSNRLDLPYALLADRRHKVAERYGVWNEAQGRTEPTTVVVDKDGRVARIIEDVAPAQHAEHVLAVLNAVEREEEWDAKMLPEWMTKANPDIGATETRPFHDSGSHPDERSPERRRPQPEDRTVP